jgi:AraC-like DNA-binding protein/Ser/Thr protein kinase RdoA (MazF antagonist)
MKPQTWSQLLIEIENQLSTTITAEEVANKVGYSVYYFYRLFSAHMGRSFSAYVLERRLKKVLHTVNNGKTWLEAAALYGFDTYAGFYKAFVKEYGCSPRKYLEIYKHENKKLEIPEVLFVRLSKQEIRRILKNWAIDPTLTITDVSTINSLNHPKAVWKIGDGYFLHQTKDRNGELKNIAIAEALGKQQLASSLPILTKAGQTFIEEDSLLILKKGVEGTALSIAEILGDSSKQYAFSYGQAIAKLHKAFLELETRILCDSSDLFEQLKSWAIPKVKNQVEQWALAIPSDFFDSYLTAFSQLKDELPTQIIHRDPNFSNILFLDQKISGFIDFDLSEKTIRLFDPCYCATSILSSLSADQYEQWLPILNGILQGYDWENPLTIEEKKAIFYVICTIQLICVAYFSDQNNADDTTKKLAQTNRNMLEYIIQKKEEIQAIFNEN